jgi:hypothetical protein
MPEVADSQEIFHLTLMFRIAAKSSLVDVLAEKIAALPQVVVAVSAELHLTGNRLPCERGS